MRTIIAIVLLSLSELLLVPCHAQTPTPGLLAAHTSSPQTPVPGMVARVYLSSSQPRSLPTHLVAVIKDGDDFIQRFKPLALDELRGVSKSTDILYIADGLIVLEKDAEIKFSVKDLHCFVDGKDYGAGVYNKTLKAGKHPIEIYRMWGHGLSGFSIADAVTGQPVLSYTEEQLTRELNHSVKLDGHTYKSKKLGEPTAAPK